MNGANGIDVRLGYEPDEELTRTTNDIPYRTLTGAFDFVARLCLGKTDTDAFTLGKGT